MTTNHNNNQFELQNGNQINKIQKITVQKKAKVRLVSGFSTKIFCFCFGFIFGLILALILIQYFQYSVMKSERIPKMISFPDFNSEPEVKQNFTTFETNNSFTETSIKSEENSTKTEDFLETTTSSEFSQEFTTSSESSESETTTTSVEETTEPEVTTNSTEITTKFIENSTFSDFESNSGQNMTSLPELSSSPLPEVNSTVSPLPETTESPSINNVSIISDLINETIVNQTKPEETTNSTEELTGSDVTKETTPLCLSSQFFCPNESHALCLDNELLCDGVVDCLLDQFDEQNCSHCNHNFRCNNGSEVQCISRHNYCDGIWDCLHGEDEPRACHVLSACQKGEFTCADGSACIKGREACDGVVDCLSDHSDEINCVNREQCLKRNNFFCSDGLCLEAGLRCDGHRDCADDELGCDILESECLAKNWFLCENRKCVEKSVRCDGVDDCGDQSDEFLCLTQDFNRTVVFFDRKEDNYSLLCWEEDNHINSDAICRRLGFFSALNVTSLPVISRTTWTHLNQSAVSQDRDCASNRTVQLECEQRECGRSQRPGVNQSSTSVSDLPVDYLVRSENNTCFAQLIASQWLILSARCQQKLSKLSPEVAIVSPLALSRNVTALRVFPHFRFSQFRSQRVPDFDFALIETRESLPEPLLPVCLPSHAIDPEITCFVRTPSGEEVSLEVLETSACNASNHFNGQLTQRHFCAVVNNNEKRRCDVMERAVLCLSSQKQWYLSGFVSYVYGCHVTRREARASGYKHVTHPVVVSHVFAVQEWIWRATGSQFSVKDQLYNSFDEEDEEDNEKKVVEEYKEELIIREDNNSTIQRFNDSMISI